MGQPTRMPGLGYDNPASTPFGESFDRVTNNGDHPVDFAAIQHSPDFVALRRRLTRVIFRLSAIFLGWYLCYVLLAAFARSFMSFRLFGNVNVGLVLGLLQFASTIVITVCYLRFANRSVDPAVARIRAAAGVDAK